MMGIYALRNTITGRMYIGSSTKLAAREQGHRWGLNGAHPHPELRADARRYGTSAFEWIILERVADQAALREAEQRWLDHYFTSQPDMLYNRERIVTRNDIAVMERRTRFAQTLQRLARRAKGLTT